MLLEYKIKIRTERVQELSDILEIAASSTKYGWELCLDGNSIAFSQAVDYFKALIERRWVSLNSIGVKNDDITIWICYEYDQQCNLEFIPEDLKKISDLNISFCISCWEGESEITLG